MFAWLFLWILGWCWPNIDSSNNNRYSLNFCFVITFCTFYENCSTSIITNRSEVNCAWQIREDGCVPGHAMPVCPYLMDWALVCQASFGLVLLGLGELQGLSLCVTILVPEYTGGQGDEVLLVLVHLWRGLHWLQHLLVHPGPWSHPEPNSFQKDHLCNAGKYQGSWSSS